MVKYNTWTQSNTKNSGAEMHTSVTNEHGG
jgi:hypothetical protein